MLFRSLLHVCDREVFLLRPEGRDAIMDGVLGITFQFLEKYDEKMLLKKFGEKNRANIAGYFKYLSKMALSTNFRDVYNERQIEYSSYRQLVPEPGEGKPLKNTLVWEFAKKISMSIKVNPNPATTMLIYALTSDLVIACKETLIATMKSEL